MFFGGDEYFFSFTAPEVRESVGRFMTGISLHSPLCTDMPDHVHDPKISARDVHVFYGDKHAIRGVSLDVYKNEVTAFIGPSGCGKSAFLRVLNRMNDIIDGCRIPGL